MKIRRNIKILILYQIIIVYLFILFVVFRSHNENVNVRAHQLYLLLLYGVGKKITILCSDSN